MDNHQTGNDAEQQYRHDVIKACTERALLFEWLNTQYTRALAEFAPGQTRENGTPESLHADYATTRAEATQECDRAIAQARERFSAATGNAPLPDVSEALPKKPPALPAPVAARTTGPRPGNPDPLEPVLQHTEGKSRPQPDPFVAAPNRPLSPISTAVAKTTARLGAMWPWPVLLGVVIALLGIGTGFSVQVGPGCGGAFDFEQKSAAARDLTSSYPGSSTIYEATCQLLAGQQMGTYWGIIGFGAALVVLGLVLWALLPVLAGRPCQASVAEELTKLATLRERGVLSLEEFEGQKTRLLAT